MPETPARATDLDTEILRQLESASETWEPRRSSGATSATEEHVFNLLLDAGLLETRIVVQVEMERQPGRVEASLVVTGEHRSRRIWAAVLERVPEWLDGRQRTRGRATLGVDRAEVRLTRDGVVARADVLDPDVPSSVCSFVRRTGFYETRGRIEPSIRVVSFRVVEVEPRDAAAAPAGSEGPAERAGAPIVVNNTIHLELGEWLDNLVEAKVAEVVASGTPREEPTGDDMTPESSGDMERVRALRGLAPRARRAGESYEWVCSEMPELVPEHDAPKGYTKAQFAYLKEHYGEEGDERSKYIASISFQTWSRYVRDYLFARDGPSNTRRAGRSTGSSVVRADEVEGRSGE